MMIVERLSAQLGGVRGSCEDPGLSGPRLRSAAVATASMPRGRAIGDPYKGIRVGRTVVAGLPSRRVIRCCFCGAGSAI
eukprot:COSAG03_NODE_1853_length_3431_cov_14.186751_2_plen_79_part_00